MKFGDKLSQLRRKNGLSQEELGEKLNVTRQTISKWELGQSKPDTDKLIEISKLLNVDFNQLANDEITIQDSSSDKVTNFDDVQPRKWLLVLLVIVAIIIIIILLNKIVVDKKERDKNQSPWGIFDVFEKIGIDDIEKDVFNSTFEFNLGTKYGSSVSSLLDDIITNNKKNSEHIITVIFDEDRTSDSNEIKNFKKKLDDWTKYEVSIDYDDNGFANVITIETITETEEDNQEIDIDIDSIINSETEDNDINADFFNDSFEFYSGTKNGITITWLLDKVITSNKTNPKHIITVIYNSTNTVDENEIRNIKKSLDDWTEYEVIFDYDEAGYITQVTITN